MRKRYRVVARSLIAGCTFLLLTGGLGIAKPGIASATTTPGVNATPHNHGGEWWPTDGCTLVPDSGLHSTKVGYGSYPFYGSATVVGSYHFTHACHHHDGCYKFHWSDRATCDQWFRNDMNASCAAIGSNEACYARATLYYNGVRVFGWKFWEQRSIAVAMNAYV
jgi:Prokaryotic phospholipase A2